MPFSDSRRSDVRDSVLWTARLALGWHSLEESPEDWTGVFALATRERCLGIAWLRSGAFIRSEAPSRITASWRARTMQDIARGRQQFTRLLETLAVLEHHGVDVVVLKGAPLSSLLYGDPFLRPLVDTDVYIPANQRTEARNRLTALGWVHAGGTAPRQELYRWTAGHLQWWLEVHSKVIDDAILDHLPFPAPARTRLSIERHDLTAHAGEELPAFLAAHLVKHQLPPLLWLVDLHTLWSQMGSAARAEAWEAARRARAHGYLTWALERTELLSAISEGSAEAIRRLGFDGESRTEPHNLVAALTHAATPLDSLKVLAGWCWPYAERRGWTGLTAMLRRRSRLGLRDATRKRQVYAAAATQQPAPMSTARRATRMADGDTERSAVGVSAARHAD